MVIKINNKIFNNKIKINHKIKIQIKLNNTKIKIIINHKIII